MTSLPGLVIFDCDGVLVDSEPITNDLMAKEMTRYGLPMTQAEAIDLFVGGTIQSVRETATKMGARLPEDWVDGFYDRMIETLVKHVKIIPDVAKVMDRLDAACIPYCVASNGPMRKMRATLQCTGLWDRLEGRIHSAHDVGIAKPDPGLFLHAANAEGVAPTACVVIEDSSSGAQAARAAGMRCFGFARDTPEAKLTAHGAVPFRQMRSLPRLLKL